MVTGRAALCDLPRSTVAQDRSVNFLAVVTLWTLLRDEVVVTVVGFRCVLQSDVQVLSTVLSRDKKGFVNLSYIDAESQRFWDITHVVGFS